jgi:hypothetical protein
MEPKLLLIQEDGGVRLESTYRFDYGGQATISIHVPLVNSTMLEVQAIACEQASAGLAKWAAAIRRQMPPAAPSEDQVA